MPTDEKKDADEELFSVERTEAGRIFASATLGGAHVGHLLMSEATARKVHRALGIVLDDKATPSVGDKRACGCAFDGPACDHERIHKETGMLLGSMPLAGLRSSEALPFCGLPVWDSPREVACRHPRGHYGPCDHRSNEAPTPCHTPGRTGERIHHPCTRGTPGCIAPEHMPVVDNLCTWCRKPMAGHPMMSCVGEIEPGSVADDVLKLTHAFSDVGRKDDVRALAHRVRRLEENALRTDKAMSVPVVALEAMAIKLKDEARADEARATETDPYYLGSSWAKLEAAAYVGVLIANHTPAVPPARCSDSPQPPVPSAYSITLEPCVACGAAQETPRVTSSLGVRCLDGAMCELRKNKRIIEAERARLKGIAESLAGTTTEDG